MRPSLRPTVLTPYPASVAWRHVRDLEGRQFADATNKKAGEFYTPRSVVRLRVNVLDPRAGESIYDPTCGTGGMLLSCIAHLRNQKKEWRNVKLYGQERNLMTSSIARMNCFLHGIEDFQIERGDTLAEPKLVEGDRLQRIVRAYQDFKDETGFNRVVLIEEIRAKEGNLSIPLYVGGETQAQTDAATQTATTALPDALTPWLESSRNVRHSLHTLITVSAK